MVFLSSVRETSPAGAVKSARRKKGCVFRKVAARKKIPSWVTWGVNERRQPVIRRMKGVVAMQTVSNKRGGYLHER